MLSVNSGVAVVVVRGAVTEASVAAVVNLWAVLGDRRWQRQRPELRGFYPHAFCAATARGTNEVQTRLAVLLSMFARRSLCSFCAGASLARRAFCCRPADI